MRAAARFVAGFVAVLIVAGAACRTVDLGAPPADVNACRPSQTYFAQEIWPNVLDKDYGGKKCSDATCHDPASGKPLTLIPNPLPMIDATMPPIPLPDDWAKNYRSGSSFVPARTRNRSSCSSSMRPASMWPST